MQIISNAQVLGSVVSQARKQGRIIGFVPTMGFLHQGHLSLVEQAKSENAFVVVSIFVNPLQFNNPEDFAKYPINLEKDFELLKSKNVDVVYTPTADQIYPQGSSVTVNPGKLAEGLEGEFRPGHFLGVTTVVSILFNQVQPDFAVFGEKDFQQLRIIEQMVRDLSIPVKIIRGQLVRESDGLAMSSRNSRLSSEGRHQALALYDILSECKNLLQSNLTDVSAIKQKAIQNVSKKYPGFTLEYLHIIDETTLLPANSITESNNLRGVIAGYIEGVRLIDTLRLAD